MTDGRLRLLRGRRSPPPAGVRERRSGSRLRGPLLLHRLSQRECIARCFTIMRSLAVQPFPVYPGQVKRCMPVFCVTLRYISTVKCTQMTRKPGLKQTLTNKDPLAVCIGPQEMFQQKQMLFKIFLVQSLRPHSWSHSEW